MGSLQFLSALSEPWCIDPKWVSTHLPSVIAAIKGESPFYKDEVSFYRKDKEQIAAANRGYDSDDAEFETFSYYLHAYLPTGKRVKLDSYSQLPEGSTAFVPIKGVLMTSDQYCGPMGMQTIGSMVQSADRSSKIKQIVFDFDTPGGMVKGNAELADIIAACEVPTIGYYLAANSAGYRLISACDHVIATSGNSVCGSIGTMIEIPDLRQFYENNGVTFHTIRATASKDKNEDYYQALEGKYELIRTESLDPHNELFLTAVRQNRTTVSEEALTGKTFLAQNAIRLGLTDATMTSDEFMAELGFINPNLNPDNMAFFSKKTPATPEEDTAATAIAETDTADQAQQLADLEAANETLTTEVSTLTATNTAQANMIAAQAVQIVELKAEVSALKALPAADHSQVASDKSGDDLVDTKEQPDWMASHNEMLKGQDLD